jgi:hypothetical protein
MTATIEQARAAIAQLAPGTIVGQAHPELADWIGVVKPNRRGRLVDLGRYVRVRWTAGQAATASGWSWRGAAGIRQKRAAGEWSCWSAGEGRSGAAGTGSTQPPLCSSPS